MRGHLTVLYLLAFTAFSIALGAAFGQRSDYLRLNKIHAPQVSVMELFRGSHTND